MPIQTEESQEEINKIASTDQTSIFIFGKDNGFYYFKTNNSILPPPARYKENNTVFSTNTYPLLVKKINENHQINNLEIQHLVFFESDDAINNLHDNYFLKSITFQKQNKVLNQATETNINDNSNYQKAQQIAERNKNFNPQQAQDLHNLHQKLLKSLSGQEDAIELTRTTMGAIISNFRKNQRSFLGTVYNYFTAILSGKNSENSNSILSMPDISSKISKELMLPALNEDEKFQLIPEEKKEIICKTIEDFFSEKITNKEIEPNSQISSVSSKKLRLEEKQVAR